MIGAVSQEELKRFDELYRRFAELQPGSVEGYKGLSPIDVSIVCIAASQPDIAVGEIAAAVGAPNSTLTSALNRLEKKKIVRRAAKRLDRRSYGIRLTETGTKLHQAYLSAKQAKHEAILAKLDTHEERELLFYLLAKMAAPGRNIKTARID